MDSCIGGRSDDSRDEVDVQTQLRSSAATVDALKTTNASWIGLHKLPLAKWLLNTIGLSFGTTPEYAFPCGPLLKTTINLPLLLFATALPRECPNYATWAIAWYLAYEGAAPAAASFVAMSAIAKEWHTVLIMQCKLERGHCMLSKGLTPRSWGKFLNKLKIATIPSALGGVRPALFDQDDLTFRKSFIEWSVAALGPGWRVISQIGHWHWQTANHAYLSDAMPLGAIRPISALVCLIVYNSTRWQAKLADGKPRVETKENFWEFHTLWLH